MNRPISAFARSTGYGTILMSYRRTQELRDGHNHPQPLLGHEKGPRDFLLSMRSSRSIPACAGEPITQEGLPCATKVYPRVCGGTHVRISPESTPRGLSPRVRGNHHRQDGTQGGHGSIPACAGEPSPAWSRSAANAVYPRVCGGTIAFV